MKLITFIFVLFTLALYSCEVCLDCFDCTFNQSYLDDKTFLIKGVASDIHKHGREIKVIEDLKGNFAGKSPIFVWGATGKFCDRNPDGRLDDLTQYHKNDTLIMIIAKVHKKDRTERIESLSDYTTLTCCCSVSKLSEGYVSGCVGTMLWEEFQELLNSIKETNL